MPRHTYLLRPRHPLLSLSSHPRYSHVVVGDGSTLPVSSSGHVSFPALSSNRPLHLNNVLVTPRIVKNLISVRQFTTDNNCSIEFDPLGFSVKDLPTRREILRSQPLPPRAFPAITTTPDVWHCRFGHLGHDDLCRLAQHVSLSCRKQLNDSSLCHACQLGRHVRLPFSSSISRTTHPFELIHCDLWTSPILSVLGNKYFLVVLDDFTHFLRTFPLRQK